MSRQSIPQAPQLGSDLKSLHAPLQTALEQQV
jgi:hypothetical protein